MALPDKLTTMKGQGKRRTVLAASKLPLRWPQEAKHRYDLFDAWHDVAMQLVHNAKGDFRLLAVMKKVIHWKTGTVTLSNADLAARAGRCTDKTITRGVKFYSDLGLFSVVMGWKKRSDGTFKRTRTIGLTLPATLPEGVQLPQAIARHRDTRGPDGDMDTRGPDYEGLDVDTRGPGLPDTRGPITIDNH